MHHSGCTYVLLYLLILPSVVWANRPAEQGHGRVNMQGSIIDTPCVIDVESRDQSIVMATIPVGLIMRHGQGPTQPFSIRLENCTLTPKLPNKPDWSKFSITFDGPVSDGRLFAVNGEGKGVGLQIADDAGNMVLPRQAQPSSFLQSGTMTLNYTLRLVANHQTLHAGPYRAAIRFKLDYY